MQNRSTRIQVIILFLLILANFMAQVPYYLYLYYNPNNLFAQARGGLLMLVVFAVFLTGSFLLFKRRVSGYWSMLGFLTVEFLFYLWNTIGEVVHGYGLFFHLGDPRLILKIVFAIGYLNLFAAGYFLVLLLLKRNDFLIDRREQPSMQAHSATPR